MIYNPHDYQKYASKFIVDHPISAIFLDCGLGKTAISLSAIDELMFNRFEISKVLVVAPLRVALNSWPEELEKWDNFRHFNYVTITGTAMERKIAIYKKVNIYIINRENLQWLIEKSGAPFDYDMVVLDELSSFKNYQSKRFKAFMKVRPYVKRIVGLTGTPSPNGMMDLFAEFKCLDMGERLGRFITQYRYNYFEPEWQNGNVVYSYKLREFAEKAIYKRISDITISMKALDHIKMPELISNKYLVQMSKEESEKYKALKKDLILESNDKVITAVNAAALSNKLSQLSNGAIYYENNNYMELHSKKLEAMEDIIEAYSGTILLCYWFKHDLERIILKLKELGVTYSKIDTPDTIKEWNKGKYKVGLIHPASAGHGLNLQAGGNMIVWFGLTWSLELYEQTIARLYRQGQKESTVVVEHIVTKGTIDERILDALTNKQKGQDALINAVKAEIGGNND